MRLVYREILLIGNAHEVRDLRQLYDRDIRHIIDLAANETPACLGRDQTYVRIPLLDGSGNDDDSIELAITTAVLLIRREKRTLIACSAGMSRSPCIAAASLALVTGDKLEDWISRIVATGPHDVSGTLWQQVHTVYQKMSLA
jgi:protein-tyrosine phosphatase